MSNLPNVNEMLYPGLPYQVTTRGGVTFSPFEDVWEYEDNLRKVKLNLGVLPVSNELLQSIRAVLIWFAENKSPAYLSNMYEYLACFFQYCTPDKQSILEIISKEHILNYRAFLPKQKEYYLANLRAFLFKWDFMELPGLDQDVVTVLKSIILKGNIKGELVSTMHPEKGPLTRLEWESIYTRLEEQFYCGVLTSEEFLLAWLVIVFGQRPIQYAALKVRDFKQSVNDSGETLYMLFIPRAKQRGRKIRDVFKKRLLQPKIGEIIADYLEAVIQSYKPFFQDPYDAPMFPKDYSEILAYLFPSTSMASFLPIANIAELISELVSQDTTGLIGHSTAHSFSNRFNSIIQRLNVKSERTGCQIKATPRRCRYSYGTRLAEEGHSELVIAELLDHTDTQNVIVYTTATIDLIHRIDKALAMKLAPLAQAFSGKVIDKNSFAKDANLYPGTIIDHSLSGSKEVGRCKEKSFCGSLAPLACYTCSQFRPWRDAPHHLVLDYLLAERERLSQNGDVVVASIMDRTILAVAEVVRMCNGELLA